MADFVELPALYGLDQLGFLAALGVLRLVTTAADPLARLSFAPDTARALLWSDVLRDTSAVADALSGELSKTAEGAVVPYAGPEFPRAKSGSGSDPMRVDRKDFPSLVEQLRVASGGVADAWLPALLTDLAVERGGERVALTPFSAPSGQQTLRTFFEKSYEVVAARPACLTEALVGWRRAGDSGTAAFSGEYLDHRAIRSAADHPSGKSVEAGVPGATWLAIMALPLLRVTVDRGRVAASLWHRVKRRPVMVWPVWRRPLDVAGVQVLLEHPGLRPSVGSAGELQVDGRTAAALGVFAVGGATRQRLEGRTFAGVLTPVRVVVTSP
jgi:CRISPR-associated endonuclease/helicase Cas3